GQRGRQRFRPRRGRGARAGPPAGAGPGRRRAGDAPADRRGGAALRRAGADLDAASVAGPAHGCSGGVRRGRRLRPAAAPPRRPDGRGDLGQRARPGVRGAPRPVRAHHDDPGRRAGPRSRRADAQDDRPPGRSEHSFRRRDAPGRLPPARRDPRHHPTALVGEHPQVRAVGQLAGRAGRSGDLDAAGGAVPGGGGDRRPQRDRRRWDAGREDHLAQLLGGRHPGTGAGGDVRGGLRAPDPAARRGGDADPAGQPGGHGGDPAAAPGQGGAADAPGPDHRGGGPAGGVPGPADQPEQRPAGDVLDPRQLGARGDRQDVHPAAAGRRERRSRLRAPDRRVVHRRRRAHGQGRHRPSAGAGDRRRPRTGRGRRRGGGRPLRHAGAAARAGRRLPAASRALRVGRHRSAGPAGARDGAL
ncbi:MAG: type II secretion system protein E, partial [uncultured Frankineae bacterium]